MGVPTEFCKGVWIGNINAASSTEFLKLNNISTVLTCGELHLPWCPYDDSAYEHGVVDEKPHNHSIPLNNDVLRITHLRLHWECYDEDRVKEYIHKGLRYLDIQKKNGSDNILIHCMAGQCRSATVALAYLLRHKRTDLLHCFNEFVKLYPGVSITPSIFRLLKMFELPPVGHTTVIKADNLSWSNDSNSGNTVTSSSKRVGTSSIDTLGDHINNALDTTVMDIVDEDSKKADCDPKQSAFAECDGSNSLRQTQYSYSCRLCRQILFSDLDVVQCQLTDKAKLQCFKKRGCQETPQEQCTSVFTTPLEWKINNNEPSGKLLCLNLKGPTHGMGCGVPAVHGKHPRSKLVAQKLTSFPHKRAHTFLYRCLRYTLAKIQTV